MSTRRQWTHIRCTYRREDVQKGLEARIADPLWMLARQWQFGEFHGDDAASPAKVVIESGTLPVTALSHPAQAKSAKNLSQNTLLEPLIEAENIETGPAALRAAGEAGLQFLRRLPAKIRPRAKQVLQKRFALAPAQNGAAESPRSHKVLASLKRGSFDGRQFRQWAEKNIAELGKEIELNPAQTKTAVMGWIQYYDARFEPAPEQPFWQQKNLEHSFKTHAKQGNSINVDLSAEEYPGGALGWHSFDIDPKSLKGNDKRLSKRRNDHLIPTPVSYSGMPADRFWDFEDGAVFFGGISLEKSDLAQVILTEFATVYSNDWFMLPVPCQTGALSRITRLEVQDIFGETVKVQACAAQDRGQRPWRFFELEDDPSPAQNLAPWLYLPRAVIGGEQGQPVESVTFTRDEMANLAWGIEELIESEAALPVNRAQAWNRVKDSLLPRPPQPRENADNWAYKLLNHVPPHWVPFAPEVVKKFATGALVRSRMGEWDLLGAHKQTYAGARGVIMENSAPMRVEEEELMRGGIRVTRSYQAARGVDGQLHLWCSKQKLPASGALSSGRETDQIVKGGEP